MALPEEPPSIEIVPAGRPQLAMMAKVHKVCFGDRFMGFMGAAYLRRVYGFMTRDAESVILAAVAEDTVVGFVAGVADRRGFYGRFLRQCTAGVLADVLRVTITRPACLPRVLRLFRRSRSAVSYSEKAFLLAIGVHPDWRGRSIASRLLDEFDRAFRAKGVGAYALTTEAHDNEATNRFYQKRGLQLIQTFQPPGREGQINEYRCVLFR